MDQSKIRDSLKAVMERVGTYTRLNDKQMEIELSWLINEIHISDRGSINWRNMPLGKQLIECLAEAQNWRCCYCGIKVVTTQSGPPMTYKPTLEHVVPLAKGGMDHPDNMVMACFRCNSLRGDQDLEPFLRLMNYYIWTWGL